MRVAIPIYHGRISAVFGVARSMHVVEAEGPAVANHADLAMDGDRARALAKHGVEVLISAAREEVQATLASLMPAQTMEERQNGNR